MTIQETRYAQKMCAEMEKKWMKMSGNEMNCWQKR